MERRVKERLVGATILVVLIVLIVPELLSGPKRAVIVAPPPLPGALEPMRSVTVDLATNQAIAGTDDAAASVVGASDTIPAAPTPSTPGTTAVADGAARSGEVASEPAGAVTAATAPPTKAVPARSTAPAQQPATSPLESGATSPKSSRPNSESVVAQESAPAEGAHRGWAAQVGSFATRANAEKLERRLRAVGFAPLLSSSGVGPGARYRVRVGPVADRAAADALLGKLKKAGFPATVAPP